MARTTAFVRFRKIIEMAYENPHRNEIPQRRENKSRGLLLQFMCHSRSLNLVE